MAEEVKGCICMLWGVSEREKWSARVMATSAKELGQERALRRHVRAGGSVHGIGGSGLSYSALEHRCRAACHRAGLRLCWLKPVTPEKLFLLVFDEPMSNSRKSDCAQLYIGVRLTIMICDGL